MKDNFSYVQHCFWVEDWPRPYYKTTCGNSFSIESIQLQATLLNIYRILCPICKCKRGII